MMVAAWMGYGFILAGLLGLAAMAVERALRLHGRPARGVWLLAGLGSLLIPIAQRWWPGAPAQVSNAPAASVDVDALGAILSVTDFLATPVPGLERLDLPLLVLWITLSIAGALALLVGTMRLHARRIRWERRPVDGTDVRLSEGFGPAVVGIREPEIVLPGWTLDLSAEERRLILLHEDEHRRGHDTQALAAAVGMALLMPWNLPVWWHLRRLRRAVELDCDARVLGRGVNKVKYGSLLLRIGARPGGPIPLAATLTEPRSLLERRIRMITKREGGGRVGKSMVAAGIAALVIAVACETPAPTEIRDEPLDIVAIEEPGAPTSDIQPTDSPLILIDGVVVDASIDEINAMSEQIERIEIVKGGAAEALYGERARNGVVQIFLRVVETAESLPPDKN